MKRWGATVAVVLMALAGCGEDSSSSSAPPKPQQEAGQAEAGRRLLDSWSKQLVPAIVLQRDRARAFEAGDAAKAAALERRSLRALRGVEKFGRDARKAFIDDPTQPEAKAVTRAGDAWTEFAYTIRTDPARGDFRKARRIADLAQKAFALHQRAYKAVGAPVPPEFQTPSG